jgi:toxin-antitoxin system PIN domain toxin
VILIDANLLIYAINSDSPQHASARRWLERTLSGTATVGLPWVVILAFIRVTTRPGVMQRPLPSVDALSYVHSWLQQPCVEAVVPGEHHWSILRNLLEATGVAGNLTSDAHIAALALEHGACVCSTDHDFARFAGLMHVNPLATG